MIRSRLLQVLELAKGTVDSIVDGPIKAVPRLLPDCDESGLCESYDGTRIYWERHGPENADNSLSPIVFCYGLVCSMNQWREQLVRYKKTRRCYILDYRGHHKSDRPQNPKKMNISSCAKDVAAVLEANNVNEPCHVFGHSMGVNVALEFALAEPNLCKSLTLICGTCNNPIEDMFKSDLVERLLLEFFSMYRGAPDVYKYLWQVVRHFPKMTEQISRLVGFNAQASAPEDVMTYSLSVANIHPETFFPLINELAKGNTEAILSKIKRPALIIAGAKDKITPIEHQKRLSEGLKNSEYIEIPAGSHNVQVDFGEYVCLKVEEYWRKLNIS